MKRSILCSIFLLIPFFILADLRPYMYTDLEGFRNTFRSQYAPIEWKESYADWDLDREIEIAKGRIAANPSITVKDYHSILKDFFNSTHDFHVSISFYSTEAAVLPLQFKSADGKYYITSLEKSYLPNTAATLKVGDEVVAINGKPTAEVLKEFQKVEFNQGSVLTDQAHAEYFFPIRLAGIGHHVPKGPITFEIKPKGSNATKKMTLAWTYVPEEIKGFVPAKSLRTESVRAAPKMQEPEGFSLSLLNKSMLSPYYTKYLQVPTYEGREKLGGKESFVPTLGKVIWSTQPTAKFHAYLFQAPDGKKIGYIRIPNYSIESSKEAENLTAQFKELVKKFQAESEGLVIDQVNNPGGSIFYMYSLISMLTDKPLTVPRHRISLTPKEVYEALDILSVLEEISNDAEAKEFLGANLHGLPVSVKTARQFSTYFKFQVDQWNNGKTITKPVALFGMDTILPHPEVRYTKPILLLINSLDFSCGDFLPAILQDNKRATLFGTRTGGAGGFVLQTTYPNLLGIESYSYTGSIAERVDEKPIENLGVTPDIEYSMTKIDLTENYSAYAASVLSTILNMTTK